MLSGSQHVEGRTQVGIIKKVTRQQLPFKKAGILATVASNTMTRAIKLWNSAGSISALSARCGAVGGSAGGGSSTYPACPS